VDVLLLLTFLMIKHAIADLFLQTYHTVGDKHKYISLSHRHYAEHAVLTLFVCVFFTTPLWAVVVAVLDYILHWHIDFAKHRIINRYNVKRNSNQFFRIQAFDQILHFLTYALIVFILMLQ